MTRTSDDKRTGRTFMTIRGAGRRVGSVARRPGLESLDVPSEGIRDAKGSDSGPGDCGACPVLRKSPSRGTTARVINSFTVAGHKVWERTN